MVSPSYRYRPPIAWYGGKSKMVLQLLALLPPHDVYVEVFGGAGWLLFAKPPSRIEVYNDVNENLVNLYRVVRDQEKCHELTRLLEFTPYSRSEYLMCREIALQSPPELSDVERAHAFLVAVRQAFAAAYHKTGWGFSLKHNKPKEFSSVVDLVRLAHQRLSTVYIECLDFSRLIEYYDTPDTLFYCDPPYLPETRRELDVYEHEMTESQHRQLLEQLNTIQGMALVSGYDHPLYRTLLDERGWHRVEFEVACHAVATTKQSGYLGERSLLDAGQTRTEVVWLNHRAQSCRSRQEVLDL